MAADAGKAERRFIELYPDLVKDLELKMFDYVKLLNGGGVAPDPADVLPTRQGPVNLETEDGYPLMPELGETPSLKKEHMRDLLRQYLTEQYSK
jgi:hypothetical protein